LIFANPKVTILSCYVVDIGISTANMMRNLTQYRSVSVNNDLYISKQPA